MSRSAEVAVGSIRRLGRIAARQPTAGTGELLSSSQPPRGNRRSLLPASCLRPNAGGFPALPSRGLPAGDTLTGAAAGNSSCYPFWPRPPVPPTSCGRMPLPSARLPPGAPRAPYQRSSRRPAALPTSQRPPFLSAQAGETALPLPRRSSARRASTSRLRRPAAGGDLMVSPPNGLPLY